MVRSRAVLQSCADRSPLTAKCGQLVSAMDALIAATALEFDLTLATHERDFEPVPSLKCEFWA